MGMGERVGGVEVGADVCQRDRVRGARKSGGEAAKERRAGGRKSTGGKTEGSV
jgi:hypothetical protein